MELAGKVEVKDVEYNKDANDDNIEAHTFDEWCQECSCIHLDDVFKETLKIENGNEDGEESAVSTETSDADSKIF